MDKVLLLKGFSQYNVLRYWTDALAIGFEKLGVEADVFDLKYFDEYLLNKYLKNHYDAVIAFNGYLMNLDGFSEKLQYPFIYLLADHPIDHLNRIQNLRQGDIITVMDRNDVNNLYHFGYNFDNTYMLPHAAIEVSTVKEEKIIDILVSGTYSNILKYKEFIENLTPLLSKICKDVIDICLLDSTKYYIDEFLNIFKIKGVPIKLDINENPELINILRVIGRYIYSMRRFQVIESLAKVGFDIHIYGNGWEKSNLVDYPNVKINKSVNYWELQRLMRQSKIVLNFQPLLRDGTHERVFAGMASNSVVFTNETPYLKEIFQSEEELLFYNFDDLSLLVENCNEILQNEKRREYISDAAWFAINGKHTFNQRAQELVNIFNNVKNDD